MDLHHPKYEGNIILNAGKTRRLLTFEIEQCHRQEFETDFCKMKVTEGVGKRYVQYPLQQGTIQDLPKE